MVMCTKGSSASNDKMHGKGVHKYAAGDISKSIGEWKECKKCGEFEDIVRVEVSKKVYYENDEVKAGTNVKREAPFNEDTDAEDDDCPPSKRSNVCVSPPQPLRSRSGSMHVVAVE